MGVQESVAQDNLPKVRQGLLYTKGATIAAISGRSTVLADLTVMQLNKIATPVSTPDLTTGDGTLTELFALYNAKVDTLNVECITAVTHGGVFKVEDANGALIGEFSLTPATGGETIIQIAGIQFTITDGATDFAAGDKFSIAITAESTPKYAPFDGTLMPSILWLGDADDITAASIAAADVSASIAYMGTPAILDVNQLVFENSTSLSTVLPNGDTVEEYFVKLGITFVGTVDTTLIQPVS